tara:strand:+ start:201 stop:1265 length:1065 start_codon:yes stop_codon:yes gene_type:complete
MASIYKTFTSNDIATVRDMLHEAIPITGTIASGTYSDNNIKTYSHDMFESVFDYPFLSSSANHIFDLTAGFATTSHCSASATAASLDPSKKINIYNEMAQILVGFDESGQVRNFDRDGDLTGGSKIKEAYIINFARLLTKDEVKKQSFTIQMLTGGVVSAPTDILTISDYGAQSAYKTNSPAGEYGILYTSSAAINSDSGVGLLYYQAGIAVLTSSIFDGSATNYIGPNGSNDSSTADNKNDVAALLISGSISGSADAVRNRLYNISFNNTVEINSTIYFCRANNTEFNYSSNPTYLSQSKIVVKENADELPRSYITSVGLYSADNELLATAKVSEPLEKNPSDEFVLRVRLDY